MLNMVQKEMSMLIYQNIWHHYDGSFAHHQVQRITRDDSESLPRMRHHHCHQNTHNLNACTIQYFCLIMRINDIQSFRALYNAASFVDPAFILDIDPKHFAGNCNHGGLVVPPTNYYELLPTMIRAMSGDEWIWKFNGDHDDEVKSLLPDEIETRSHLEESFGYNALENIYATYCR